VKFDIGDRLIVINDGGIDPWWHSVGDVVTVASVLPSGTIHDLEENHDGLNYSYDNTWYKPFTLEEYAETLGCNINGDVIEYGNLRYLLNPPDHSDITYIVAGGGSKGETWSLTQVKDIDKMIAALMVVKERINK
jgi:hypothetical protein